MLTDDDAIALISTAIFESSVGEIARLSQKQCDSLAVSVFAFGGIYESRVRVGDLEAQVETVEAELFVLRNSENAAVTFAEIERDDALAQVETAERQRDELAKTLDEIDHLTYGWTFPSVGSVIDRIRLKARAALDTPPAKER